MSDRLKPAARSSLIFIPLCVALSCTKAEPQAPTLPQVTKGTAQITGKVTLVGTPPEMKSESIACNPSPGSPKMYHKDKTVAVSDTGGLADTYVYVKSSASGPLKGSGAKEPPLLLDQVDCAFSPHALAIQIGQSLRIRNSDPTFHNVHWDGQLNPAINVGFSPAPIAPERIVSLSGAEFLSVRCDVHGWMTSTIGVFDHPFFAVSDANGNYTINNLPPGTYTLNTYHPYYGHGQDQTVTIPPPTPTAPAPTLDFSYITKTK